jgi:hypothetical protein
MTRCSPPGADHERPVAIGESDERDGRRRSWRLMKARLPRLKRLEDYDLSGAPGVNPATVDRGQPDPNDGIVRPTWLGVRSRRVTS